MVHLLFFGGGLFVTSTSVVRPVSTRVDLGVAPGCTLKIPLLVIRILIKFVTCYYTSKAPVTTSVALVPSRFLR